jgi:spiro-SPASM protein
MSFEKCSKLIDDIAAFSEKAVISLSAWGEPLYHPDFVKILEKILSYDGLSVFFETDGLLVNEELCLKLSEIEKKAAPRTNGWQKLMVAVILDAASEPVYQKLHKNSPSGAFQTAVNAVSLLQNALPGAVYPQFIRMNENEAELEAFFRYWNEKANPSGGNLIIQKYDDFAGLLPDCKPADLSPLDRDPCWHIRRDLTILSNGQSSQCRACLSGGSIAIPSGNVFSEGLQEVWKKNDQPLKEHINHNYCEKCGKCDEWYTFNF